MARLVPTLSRCLLGAALVGAIAPASATPVNLRNARLGDPNWLIDGAVDARYRTASPGTNGEIYTQTIELDVQHPISYHHQRKGNFFLQGIIEHPPDQTGKAKTSARIGEAYLSYQLPILTQTDSLAYVKAGQFAVPLGLTPVYDTHLQIMQTLYPEAIGERLDWGVGVDGRFYGVLDYKAAVTAGAGPGRVDSNSGVVSFRLGRLFATPAGAFNVGGSMLSGHLPKTMVDPATGYSPTLPPSGYVTAPYGYVAKTRIAGDGQWTYRQATVRGEAIVGADGEDRVFGYFVQGEYRIAPGVTAIVARKYWDYGVSGSKTEDNGAGINVSYGNNLSIRTLIEERHDVPVNSPSQSLTSVAHFRHLFTVQVLGRF